MPIENSSNCIFEHEFNTVKIATFNSVLTFSSVVSYSRNHFQAENISAQFFIQ